MTKSINEAIQETAKGLYNIGLFDTKIMHDIELLGVPPVELLTAKEIKQLRLSFQISQVAFAKYLNVKPVTIRKWESGKKHPGGPALKLLNILKHNGLDALDY